MDSIFEINRRNIEMVTPDIVVYLESQRADEAEKRGYREVLEYALSTRAIAPHVIVRRGSDLLNWENTFVVIDDLKPLILNRLENSEGTYMRVEAKV
jgi:hypothetical protein